MRPISLDYDAVVFDCDGTLVNTEHAWNLAYQHLFDAHGKTLAPTDRSRLVGLQLRDLGHVLAGLLDHPAPPDTLGRTVYHLVRTNAGHGVHALPGATELVNALHRTVPLAVATNTPTEIVDHHLTRLGIRHCFEIVVDSVTATCPKPDPAPYLLACAHLGIPATRAIAIEDSATGATSAHAAGLHVIGVPSHPDITLDADHRFTTLNDPELWKLLGLPAPTAAGGVPVRPGHRAEYARHRPTRPDSVHPQAG